MKKTKKKRTKAASPELKKIAIICTPGLDGHLDEVANHLTATHEVKLCVTGDLNTIFETIAWADIVWIEWANQLAVTITCYGHLLYQKQVILRLHSYEAFTQDLDYICWEYITDLIFVADHIRRMVLKRFPTIEFGVDRVHVIPNGIDTERFCIPKKPNKNVADHIVRSSDKKKIAYLGYMNFKKGTQLMLRAFSELVRCDPEFTLWIGGEFQDPRYVEYLNQMQAENPLLKERIFFKGWQTDPVVFLSDKSHIICTSLLESQCKAVMEAMSMGLKPLVHNFVGAKEIYPIGIVWSDIYEFCSQAMSASNTSAVYRDFIVKNFNTIDILKRIDGVLNDRPESTPLNRPGGVYPPVTLSATMIMKNEVENLPRCLDSIRDICDEIIIVDTGSTDGSIGIAKKYGAKIYKHKWEDDFSLHRNQAFEYATGDWNLVIDCDEELIGDRDQLKKILARLNDGYNAVSINVRDAHEDLGNEVNGTRLFRQGKAYYRRAWHNVPIAEGMEKTGSVLCNDVSLIHHGSINAMGPETAKKKAERTKQLCEKALEQDPEDWELYFYMMQAYGVEEKWQAAANVGEKYIGARNKLNGFQYSVYFTLIRVYAWELNNLNRAIELLNAAKIFLPEDLDIAFVECEIGAAIGNGTMVVEGASRFVRMYEVYKNRPDAKAGRFIFNLKPESLLFCLKHMTSYQLQNGVNSLKLLQGAIAEFPPEDQAAAEKQVTEILEPLNIDTH